MPAVVQPSNGVATSDSTNKDVLEFVAGHADGLHLRVATLNCWGLLFFPERKARFKAIAASLKEAKYDLVGLQEVWKREDWQYLKEACREQYPYSYYFKSGVIGSGLAVLSAYPIQRVAWHSYSLNGSPHYFYHGDWFASKGVGACRVQVPHGNTHTTVDFFNTHIHAQYDAPSNQYTIHQLLQLSEYRRFVEVVSGTSMDDHVIITVGDFNCLPEQVPFRAIVKHSAMSFLPSMRLADSWTNAKNIAEEGPREAYGEGATFNVPNNKYHNAKKPPKRIDYILYVPNGRTICAKAQTIVTHNGISLSDHCLLAADFLVLPRTTSMANLVEQPPQISELEDLNNLLEQYFLRELYLLNRRQLWCRFTSITSTLAFLGLFIATLCLIMWGSISDIGLAAMVSITPLPLTLSIVAGLVGELTVPFQQASVATLFDEWRIFMHHLQNVKRSN